MIKSAAVQLSFDPPLEVSETTIFQLQRAHSPQKQQEKNNESENEQEEEEKFSVFHQISDSEKINDFILIAMNQDGTWKKKKKKNNSSNNHLPLCVAPSLEKDCVAKPLMKESVTLVPFSFPSSESENVCSSSLTPFTWHVERFPGGGIAFKTKLEKVSEWKRRRLSLGTEEEGEREDEEGKETASSTKANLDPRDHYLTDDSRLCSTKHTEGQPVGFSMLLEYPPIVDVTALLETEKKRETEENQNAKKSSSTTRMRRREIYQVARNLVDAAFDCGFFFAVINDGDKFGLNGIQSCSSSSSSSFTSANSVKGASERLLSVIRKSFGRALSLREIEEQKRLLIIEQDQKNNNNNNNIEQEEQEEQEEEEDQHESVQSRFTPLGTKSQLTKVTLKSTTGKVKVNVNPIEFAEVNSTGVFPAWLRHVLHSSARNYSSHFLKDHVSFCDDCSSSSSSSSSASSCAVSQVEENEESEKEEQQQRKDLDIYFHFGEELAARIIALLLKGGSESLQQGEQKQQQEQQKGKKNLLLLKWPTELDKKRYHQLRDIVETEIVFGQDDDDEVPRIKDPNLQLYSLFRAVCYPPSRKGWKKEKEHQQQQQQKKEEDNNEDDEEVEEIFEEVEEIVEEVEENENEDDKNSVATNDSEGKALYEHSDKTWITLLVASPSLRGLQTINCDGEGFTDLKLPANLLDLSSTSSSSSSQNKQMCFICNIGDAMQLVSLGKMISRTHRARNPKSHHNKKDKEEKEEKKKNSSVSSSCCCCCCDSCRVSLPLFVEPSPEPDRWPRSFQAQEASQNQLLEL